MSPFSVFRISLLTWMHWAILLGSLIEKTWGSPMNTSSRLAARGLFGPANYNSQEVLGLMASLNDAEDM
ncbi:hypothetical protein VE04_03398, partial [Pseudogymnoascus sp. 24MN13]